MINPAIQFSESRRDRRAVLRISGKILSGASAGRLLARVRGALRRGIRDMTVDLADLGAIDCSGIGALLACLRDAERQGATFRVHRSHGPIRLMLARSFLLEVLEGGALPGKDAPAAGQDVPVWAPA